MFTSHMFDVIDAANQTEDEMVDVFQDQFGFGVSVVDEQADFDEFAELVGFGCIVKKDYEKEVEYWDCDEFGHVVKVIDDGCSVEQPYWTKSGDNPVIMDEATQHDLKGSRLMSEHKAPKVNFYSVASNKWGNGKKQERSFHTVVGWVEKNKDNSALLRRGWSRFWKNVYAGKKQNTFYMFPSQVKAVKDLFGKYGIVPIKK